MVVIFALGFQLASRMPGKPVSRPCAGFSFLCSGITSLYFPVNKRNQQLVFKAVCNPYCARLCYRVANLRKYACDSK